MSPLEPFLAQSRQTDGKQLRLLQSDTTRVVPKTHRIDVHRREDPKSVLYHTQQHAMLPINATCGSFCQKATSLTSIDFNITVS